MARLLDLSSSKQSEFAVAVAKAHLFVGDFPCVLAVKVAS